MHIKHIRALDGRKVAFLKLNLEARKVVTRYIGLIVVQSRVSQYVLHVTDARLRSNLADY